MKRKTHWLLFIPIAFVIGCKSTDNKATDQPRILSVSFQNVPAENVKFDPAYQKIVVRLPSTLPNGLKPNFELTSDTQIVDGLAADNSIDITAFCGCQATSSPTFKQLRVANRTTSISYDLYVITTDTLKARTTSDQFVISRNSNSLELQLPVENLYTNPYVRQLKFTNLESGKTTIVQADGACLNSCQATIHDRLVFSFSFGYSLRNYFPAPGTYSITADELSFPQKLIVTD